MNLRTTGTVGLRTNEHSDYWTVIHCRPYKESLVSISRPLLTNLLIRQLWSSVNGKYIPRGLHVKVIKCRGYIVYWTKSFGNSNIMILFRIKSRLIISFMYKMSLVIDFVHFRWNDKLYLFKCQFNEKV